MTWISAGYIAAGTIGSSAAIVGAADTSIVITPQTLDPTFGFVVPPTMAPGDQYYARWDGVPPMEHMLVTDYDAGTHTLTVTRGVLGTTARAHAPGEPIRIVIDASTLAFL